MNASWPWILASSSLFRHVDSLLFAVSHFFHSLFLFHFISDCNCEFNMRQVGDGTFAYTFEQNDTKMCFCCCHISRTLLWVHRHSLGVGMFAQQTHNARNVLDHHMKTKLVGIFTKKIKFCEVMIESDNRTDYINMCAFARIQWNLAPPNLVFICSIVLVMFFLNDAF